ncbi:hypothetical protein N825_35210 [Skermanella stibiiresistens SB22]|uniref:YCII-related domain-containing protein n=1 Tax=Skermanella stibiiresistens SB22 TaxID=1385369 RepID=W9H9K8_9PROT|nr:YciI family protein [Skermanella stibiiresistens]EWY40523.1 hypothetical protein N825_35210 [Skermanella stibiiresistens SB22]
MLYIIDCADKAGSGDIRASNRTAHLAYLESFGDKVFAAGPTLTDDGSAMTGSVLIVEFDDRAAAERFCADDPYAKAGLFESVTIRPWRKVLPKSPA